VTAEEAQRAQDVVLDMFLSNSHPATILLDCRASHSFISSRFVAKYNLSITIMKHIMLFSTPGGEMKIKHIYPVVSNDIRGGGRLFVKPHHLRLQGHRHHPWYEMVKEI
jgi:hypothetical protein